jgi:hypothetical protein
MLTQSGTINGFGDVLKTLIVVELAKRLYLYTFIKPKICYVCINATIILYPPFSANFTHLKLISVAWHLISIYFFALYFYFLVRARRFSYRNF